MFGKNYNSNDLKMAVIKKERSLVKIILITSSKTSKLRCIPTHVFPNYYILDLGPSTTKTQVSGLVYDELNIVSVNASLY